MYSSNLARISERISSEISKGVLGGSFGKIPQEFYGEVAAGICERISERKEKFPQESL